MFNLLFWSSNVFEAKVLNWYSSQYKLTKFWLLILVRKIHILAKKMVPHIFYQTPRFPSDLAFSTPWDPVPHTRIFQLSKENRNTAPLLHMTAHTFHVTKLVGLIESDWFIPNGWQICINFTQECVTECSQADILECVLVLISTEINSDFWAGQFQVWILRPITYTKRTDFPWPSVTYT